MQRFCVDGNLRRLSLFDARPGVEARNENRLSLLDADGSVVVGSTCILRELAGLVGLGGPGLDRHVRHDLRSERLAQDNLTAEKITFLGLARDSRVLEVLRPDSKHDVAPGELPQAGPVR